MNETLAKFLSGAVKSAAALLILNELRGALLAIPVLYAMFQAGGSMMAIWIGFCSLAGIALSVMVPLWLARKADLALRMLTSQVD